MSNKTKKTARWVNALHSPWTVACAVVTVVIGPTAVTASALDRANAAPPYHQYEALPPHAVTAPQSLKRSHSLG
ncbi:hypothetical protein AB0D57_04890 [Streptomyces sp. NPDC048275]|uniref:hypothetical protein n=1 Tax=Streptomyces sp. NPDC048275 TaxID=3155629 RepID=UPI0033E2B7A2